MADEKDENKGPATPSTAWEYMAPKWAMINTILAGTHAMRLAAQTYLPQHTGENHGNYDERLKTATLLNMLELTLDTLVGKPFSEPLRLNGDVPAEISAIANDIDMQGNSIHSFCRAWFHQGFAKAFAHCYIDVPAPQTEPGAKRTKADDRFEGRRPFWSLIAPENVIFMLSDMEGGKEVLTHVRILETDISLSGWVEEVKLRVRVLTPGAWELWELVEKKDKKGKPTGKKEWKKIDSGDSGINVIPIVTFYATERDRPGLAKPPLEDLAYLNVRHWQSSSDQNNILTVARFPILAVAGINDQAAEQVVVGPRTLLSTKNEQGRYYYVEHTGAAIAQGWHDLADLENQMTNYGAEFLRKSPGNQTATARALNSAEATSPLQDSAYRFLESVTAALDLTARWLGINSGKGGTAEFTADLKPDPNEAAVFAAIMDSFKEGAIDAEEVREEFRRWNVLNDKTRVVARSGVQSATVVSAQAKKTAVEKLAAKQGGVNAS